MREGASEMDGKEKQESMICRDRVTRDIRKESGTKHSDGGKGTGQGDGKEKRERERARARERMREPKLATVSG